MKLTRILAIVLLISMSLAVSCLHRSNRFRHGWQSTSLLCGRQPGEFGGSVYHAAVQEAKCGFHTVELGKNATNYQATVDEALNQSGAEIVVIVGREAYNGLADYIKSFRGMNFIVVDASLTEIPANVCALEFQPEEYGYLSGKLQQPRAPGMSDTFQSGTTTLTTGFCTASCRALKTKKYMCVTWKRQPMS